MKNKFSALTPEDQPEDEDTQLDETMVIEEASSVAQTGQPGHTSPMREASTSVIVPDGTIQVMGVVHKGAALQDPLTFPMITTQHLLPKAFQQSESYLDHIRTGHAIKNPNCMECVLGGQQATKTAFGKSTDTRMPADDGIAAACDFWGPTVPKEIVSL